MLLLATITAGTIVSPADVTGTVLSILLFTFALLLAKDEVVILTLRLVPIFSSTDFNGVFLPPPAHADECDVTEVMDKEGDEAAVGEVLADDGFTVR